MEIPEYGKTRERAAVPGPAGEPDDAAVVSKKEELELVGVGVDGTAVLPVAVLEVEKYYAKDGAFLFGYDGGVGGGLQASG